MVYAIARSPSNAPAVLAVHDRNGLNLSRGIHFHFHFISSGGAHSARSTEKWGKVTLDTTSLITNVSSRRNNTMTLQKATTATTTPQNNEMPHRPL
eukprot:scaffold316_cov188-Alexandrium_tamarense.AAC.14